MEFRPCIDIHNGKVKQIVGSSLQDACDKALENFVSEKNAAWYASYYKELGIRGGHVILLNGKDSPYYEDTRAQALEALAAFPKGLQIGGGITEENAQEYLRAGASHVIVTSYVFRDGHIKWENLEKMKSAAGKEHLVLDVSCRKRDGQYRIVTDRWQKESQEILDAKLLDTLSAYCDEFLVHAVDVEGKAEGIEGDVVRLLGTWGKIPVTYAGGVRNREDIRKIRESGKDKVNVTIGSALDLFGGPLALEQILACIRETAKA